MAGADERFEFVGRAAEVATLRRLTADVAAGRGSLVWLEGEPGIGKTALLRQGLIGAEAAGCRVRWAAGDRLRQNFPLGVMLDCLGVDGSEGDPAHSEIARMLRMDPARRMVPAGDVLAVAAERLCELVDEMCTSSPVIVVVDDLQWADETSVSVWHRLAGAVDAAPLLVVGAARPLVRGTAAWYARHSVRDRGGTQLSLDRLADEEVASLVAGLAGATPGPDLLALAAQAAGNPLYVRELVDALRREDRLRIAGQVARLRRTAAGDPDEPVSLAAAIEDRLGFLSDRTLRSLRLAALLGGRFSVGDVAIVEGCPVRELVDVVREAVTAGVLTASGTDLVFRHALLQQALIDGMPAGLQAELHREAARYLAAAGSARSKVAAQLLAAESLHPMSAADSWIVEWLAANGPELVYRAPRMAAQLLEQAMPAAAGADAEVLAESHARALLLLGRHDLAQRAATRLIDNTTDQRRRVRTAWILGYTLLRTGQTDLAHKLIAETLADPATPQPWRARFLALSAMCLFMARCDDDATTAAEAALLSAGAVNDRLAGGYALHVLFGVRVRAGDDDGALETMDRALELIGDDPETTDLRLMLSSNRLTLLSLLGRDIETDARELLVMAERAGNTRIGTIRWTIGQHLFHMGQWDDALAELAPLFEPGVDMDEEDMAEAHGLAALIAAHRDDRSGLERHLSAVDELPDLTDYRREHLVYAIRARAVMAERDGRPGDAAKILAVFTEPDQIDLRVQRGDWSPLPDIVRCSIALGDIDAARTAAAASEEHAERCASHAPASASQAAAAAKRCRGLAESDAEPLAEAVAIYRAKTLPLYLAHALEDLAVVLGAGEEQSAARAALREAVDIYASVSADWDIVRADARARTQGVRRRRQGTRRPATGWEALTPTETTVAYLVAEGLSNPQIGARMFLSWRTVRFHVSAIMTKLDVHSRVEIARQVAQAPSAAGHTGDAAGQTRHSARAP